MCSGLTDWLDSEGQKLPLVALKHGSYLVGGTELHHFHMGIHRTLLDLKFIKFKI